VAVTQKTLANLTPGRRGQPSKYTRAIKDMVEEALDRAGGVDYLIDQSAKNPVAFLGLIGKLLPRDIKVDVSVDGRSLIDVLLERREQLADMRGHHDTIEATPVGTGSAGAGEEPSVRKVRRPAGD
jgi:hypothetical protein